MSEKYIQIETERLQKELKRVNHQIARTQKRVDYIKNHHEAQEEKDVVITKHGGWDLGYYEGRLYILEERQDFLNELLTKVN